MIGAVILVIILAGGGALWYVDSSAVARVEAGRLSMALKATQDSHETVAATSAAELADAQVEIEELKLLNAALQQRPEPEPETIEQCMAGCELDWSQ